MRCASVACSAQGSVGAGPKHLAALQTPDRYSPASTPGGPRRKPTREPLVQRGRCSARWLFVEAVFGPVVAINHHHAQEVEVHPSLLGHLLADNPLPKQHLRSSKTALRGSVVAQNR